VETLTPAAALHDAAGELVDDLDLAVLDDVVDVLLVQGLRRSAWIRWLTRVPSL
jgi:hypothetical protein